MRASIYGDGGDDLRALQGAAVQVVDSHSSDGVQQEGNVGTPNAPHARRDLPDRLVHGASHPRPDGQHRRHADGRGRQDGRNRRNLHRPEGGRARSFHVSGTAAADLLPIIKAHVASGSHVMTDEAGQYTHLGKHFARHEYVTHGTSEYVRGDVHTNTLEGFYSVFKRGMKGIYQHCAGKHLHRYVSEFDFRYNNRTRLGVDDAERAARVVRGAAGKRLMYRWPDGASAA